ncbi:MAG: hypothetical protein WBV92_01310 [Nitrosotalea sp.]
MKAKNILFAIGIFFVIALVFYGGTMAMNTLCIADKGTYNPQWDQNSDLVCQLFGNIAQVFTKITSSI